jgi:hypothetical protein
MARRSCAYGGAIFNSNHHAVTETALLAGIWCQREDFLPLETTLYGTSGSAFGGCGIYNVAGNGGGARV